MKVVKFIFVVIIIVGIILGIPCFIQNNIDINNYFTQVENAHFKGPAGYFGLIIQNKSADQETLNNAVSMMKDYGNAIIGQKRDFCTLLFVVELLLGISIITIGIILLKLTTKKLVPYAFITSGILAISGYIFIFYVVMSTYTIRM